MTRSQPGEKTDVTQPSGVVAEGEAAATPDERHGSHYAIKCHRRNREPLCPACRDFQRAYDREYARLRRKTAAGRAKMYEAHRRYARAVRADPVRGAALNARRRQLYRQNLDRLRRAIDEVAVRRAAAGEPVRLTADEKRAALQLLLNRGMTLNAAAQVLRINGQYARKYATEVAS